MRTRILSTEKLLTAVVCLLLAAPVAWAQDKGKNDQDNKGKKASPISPRETPLGTQKPKPVPAPEPKKEPEEPESDTLSKAIAAHGGKAALASIQDSISEGKLTYFMPTGPGETVDIVVIRKGDNKALRTVKRPDGGHRVVTNGSDSWENMGGFRVAVTGGAPANFLESQTVRSVSTFLDSQARGLQVKKRESKDDGRALEVEVPRPDKEARKTKYVVDKNTSRVTRVEWETGEKKDLFGRTVQGTESYVYADFRNVQGVPTPFKIERYIDGLKVEETQFTSVRYNTSVKDDVFKQ